MVLDYADNGSLREYLSISAIKLDWPANYQLGLDIISGLRHIHSVGILHKDLVSVVLINTILFNVDCILTYCFSMLSQVFEQCINSWENG